MKKINFCISVLAMIVVTFFLISCGKDNEGGAKVVNGDIASVPLGELEPTILYWAVPDTYKISDEAKRDLSEYLQKQSFAFDVEFVYFDIMDYGALVNNYIANGNPLDLVFIGFSDNSCFFLDLLASGKLESLDGFLVENPDIKKQYPDLLWETVTYNDSVLALPTWATYKETEYSFNPAKFTDEIKNFTASEEEITNLLKREDITIALCTSVESILPCNVAYGLGFPHNGENPVNVFSRYADIFTLLNKRFAEGSLIFYENIYPQGEEDFDVYIGYAPNSEYANVNIKHRLSPKIMGLSIFAESENKEGVKALLGRIYADPALANLLIYGSQGSDYEIKDSIPYASNGLPCDPFLNILSLGRSFYSGLFPTRDAEMCYPQDMDNPIEVFNKTVIATPYIGFIPALNGMRVNPVVTTVNTKLVDSRELMTEPPDGDIIDAALWLAEVNKELAEAGIEAWLLNITEQCGGKEW